MSRLAAYLGKLAGQNYGGTAGATSGQGGHNGGAASGGRMFGGAFSQPGGLSATAMRPSPRMPNPMTANRMPVNRGAAVNRGPAPGPSRTTAPAAAPPTQRGPINQEVLGLAEKNPLVTGQFMGSLGSAAPLALLAGHQDPVHAFRTLFDKNYSGSTPQPATPQPPPSAPPASATAPNQAGGGSDGGWVQRILSSLGVVQDAGTLASIARAGSMGSKALGPVGAAIPYALEGANYLMGGAPSASEFTQQTSYDPSQGFMRGILDPMLRASENPVRSNYRLSRAVNPWDSQSLWHDVGRAASGMWQNRGSFEDSLRRYQDQNAALIAQRKLQSGLWAPNPQTGALEYVGPSQ